MTSFGPRTVTVCSGGLDSVTLAHLMATTTPAHEHVLVSFDYGQRHVRELECAARCAQLLGSEHVVIALDALTPYIATSSLTADDVPVPDGHYAEDSMRATVVPNRNMVLLSIAGALAVARGAERMAIGVHAGDHFVYPDCRPEFVYAMQTALRVATLGYADPYFHLAAPFLQQTKADIVAYGRDLEVPFADTWSCYRGGDVHCGSCGTCYERREAFVLAGVEDPTVYAATPSYADPR